MLKVDTGLLIPKFGNPLSKLWQAIGFVKEKHLSLLKLLSKNIVFVLCRQCLLNTEAQEGFFRKHLELIVLCFKALALMIGFYSVFVRIYNKLINQMLALYRFTLNIYFPVVPLSLFQSVSSCGRCSALLNL